MIDRGLKIALLALALLPASAARAQLMADAPPAAVVGVACVDLDEDGACSASDLPLPDCAVRLSNGLGARTDHEGRFHIAAAGAERTTLLGSSVLPRPEGAALFIDAHALGPTARPPSPLAVSFAPAVIASVALPVRLPMRPDAPPPALAGAPAVQLDGDGLVAVLPLALAPGHTLSVDGREVSVDAAGAARLSVPLIGREALVLLLDTAPDGRVTLARLRLLRVPRAEGGELLVIAPLTLLAQLDLPPRDRAVAPGPLLVPVRAAVGAELQVGEARAVVGDSGVAYLWTRATEAVEVQVRRGDVTVRASLPLTVDALAAMSARLAGELRAGAVGLTPFAQGRLDAALRVPVADTMIAAGLSVDDELAGAALLGRLRLQPARTVRLPRAGDPEVEQAVWGDNSRGLDDNPAQLALWALAQGPWGQAGLGAARTPLDEGEVGRFDRPIVGPFADAALSLGGVRVGLEAAADARAMPFVDAAAWRKAHDEIEASGGRVYWLSRRMVAPGSERVALELHDPLTGMVLERRVLAAGADYELDRFSGRILLAAPLGLAGSTDTARPNVSLTAQRARLVVDYAHAPGVDEDSSSDGAARVFIEAGDVVGVGLRGALSGGAQGSAQGGMALVGADLSARPLPWLALSASAAHSEGDPLASAGLARSADAGLSFVTASGPGAAARPEDESGGPAGDALALRARIGGARSFVAGWGAYRAPGFGDGAHVDPMGAARAGAEGRLELFDALDASTLVEARSSADPAAAPSERVRLSALDVAARVQGRLGGFRLALDGVHHAAERVAGRATQAGDASALGAELGVSLAKDLEVFAGHLQRVRGQGEGPGALDPTLSYLGARIPLGERALVWGRFGLHPDWRPEATFAASYDEHDGPSRYGMVAVASDAPWGGRGTTLVSGARQTLGPDVDVYAEDRVSQVAVPGVGGTSDMQAARVVGARVRPGPLFAGVSIESGARLHDAPGGWRGALAVDAGVALASLMLQGFGELAADDAAGALGARHFALGAQAHARLLDDVTLGTRALIARGAPLDGSPERPHAELFVGGAWRPADLPELFLHYALREQRREAAQVARLHLARAALAFGRLPETQLLLSSQAAQHELAERDALMGSSQALLASARLTAPFWLLEPALELGARAVMGSELPAALGGSVRAEAAIRLGPAALGLGVVLLGYTGSGLEELTLDPPAPPVYLVVRGALS